MSDDRPDIIKQMDADGVDVPLIWVILEIALIIAFMIWMPIQIHNYFRSMPECGPGVETNCVVW